jgi:hypothetical protein
LERDKHRLDLKEMSRYVTKLCTDKERLIRISKERISQLEKELLTTQESLKKYMEELSKSEKAVRQLQSERDKMR